MMSALDGCPPSVHDRSVPAETTVDHVANLSRPRSHGNRKQNAQHWERKDAVDANDLPTDVSVALVPSENLSYSPKLPVTVVSKDHSDDHVLAQNGSSVRGALAELQQLRGSFAERRIIRVPPPSASAVPVGKENQPSVTGGRPFAALLDSLRRMNPELGGGRGRSTSNSASPAPFRLLRLPTLQAHDFSVKFPRVVPPAGPVWKSMDQRPTSEECWQMPAVNEQARQGVELHQIPSFWDDFPLLHLSENRFPSVDHDAASLNGLPFPMLQMVDPRRGPVPFFIPPENIVGHNNNNREVWTARSDEQSARPEPQTRRSGIPVSSQRTVKLLHLPPCLPEAENVLKTDSR